MAYHTRQKDAVLSCLQEMEGRHASAAEVAERLFRRGERVGLSTVYRQLDRLVGEGLVRRFVTDGSGACYQYVGGGEDCTAHFHLKCESCGKLIHLHCRTFERLNEHILAEHGFLSDPGRTTLYGTCAECRARAEAAKGGEEA